MKKLIIIITILLVSVTGFSQDLAYFTNGNLLKVNTLTQSNEGITFTLYNSSTEEVFSAKKSELIRLIKENGEIINFEGKKSVTNNDGFPRSIVAFNVLHTPQGRLTMAYKFINNKGNIGFEVPVSVGLFEDFDMDPIAEIFNYSFYSMFYTGFTVNWYPLGQRKVSYLLGPSFRIGIAKDRYYYDYNYYDYNEPKEQYYSKLLLNNGLMLSPNNHFNISFIISMGIMHHNAPPGEYKFRTTADAAINLAFRF
ncbi:MAG: hypothetical protein C0595_10340 [Marinilabiliales bacterium]|nr:MAG: hypothetical protein C0595_10340 [Marinilabiliales bacterium]